MRLPSIELSNSPSDAIVLSWFKAQSSKPDAKKGKKNQESKPAWTAPEYVGKKDKVVSELLGRLSTSKHFSGAKHETSVMHFVDSKGYPNTILLGLGVKKRWSGEMARQAGAALFMAQRKSRLGVVTVEGDALLGKAPKGQEGYYLQAFCEGYLLAGYKYHDLKSKSHDTAPESLRFSGLKKSFEKFTAKADVLAKAVCFSRSLGDRPGNHLTPEMFAQIVQAMSKEKKLKCTVFDKARLEKEKMGLFLSVAEGSDNPPRMIRMEYNGGKKGDKPIALIGKGITFDSGGISLKPSLRMEEMKYDMMGAATVAGIMSALPGLGIKQNVVGYIAAAENMPSGRATKPGDVMFSSSGKSVEITNTDAEGRLVLADTIEYAQKGAPQAMIDFATLTGAVVVALGSCVTGVMGTSPKLIGRLKEAADVTAEKVWQLPLYEEYEVHMRSAVADIKNASDVREAGSQKGGIFLKHFVDQDIPWVHCDIAGSGMTRSDLNYAPRKYGSGVMVRLIAHMLENWKKL